MNILVIAATIEEIMPSLPFLDEREIPSLITGVGMLATTYALTKTLQQRKIDLIVQVGIGGISAFKDKLGTVYQIVSDEVYEFGAEDQDHFLTIDTLGYAKSYFLQRMPSFPMPIPCVREIRGITVNKVHGNASSIAQLRSRYDEPIMESMEGAAAFFVAHEECVPILQFRAASNYIEPRDRDSWQIGLAVKNLNDFLQELLNFLR
ncbi:nucleoside phosphorylase-I family protein [Sphingobacterium griseoflavum]|uniref:Futalosine hydrolase n=1 Tax=Sphingobacterium griseoflavum TaxID=1474952 RepID=A0ABQ3HS80_9SPHI|nr:futalosine hydrolase [Sphingobacterium griseoflavum]GHE29551.1 hypothetical protein GCM10017764_10610 [Sphingobacterium griseoflavum]